MWISDRINWIISKRAKLIFFKITSYQSIYHDESNDVKFGFKVDLWNLMVTAVRGGWQSVKNHQHKKEKNFVWCPRKSPKKVRFFFQWWFRLRFAKYFNGVHWLFFSGQSPAEADLNLLETARRCELYGVKMHASKVRNFEKQCYVTFFSYSPLNASKVCQLLSHFLVVNTWDYHCLIPGDGKITIKDLILQNVYLGT